MHRTKRLALRAKARRLRRQGLSYKEIREKVDVAKSTLSLWLKDVPLKPEHRARLYTQQIEILSRGTASQQERRKREIDLIIEKSFSEIAFPLSLEAYRLFGVALYWGEGNKTKNFGFTNSDPRLVIFMIDWLKTVFNLEPTTLKAHLNIYSQQDDAALKNFWSELTGIPVANFGKSFIKPANKGSKKNNLYYGTISIYVPKATNLIHVVYAWRKAVLQKLENEIYLTERKWISLKETPRPVNLSENQKPL